MGQDVTIGTTSIFGTELVRNKLQVGFFVFCWVALSVTIALSYQTVSRGQRESRELALPKVVNQAPVSSDETRTAFHRLKTAIDRLEVSDVCYDRIQQSVYGRQREEVFEDILSLRHSIESLRILLSDPDPKVRTLAMVALYNKEDPQVLPDIAKLSHDDAQTYFREAPTANGPRPLEPQSVSEFATGIVEMYMEPAGFYYGVDGYHSHAGFTEYWKTHKGLSHCASWFTVKLQRASTGCSPIDPARKENIIQVRRQLDAIEGSDRDWILLWLQQENGFDWLASEQDVLVVMNRLGPEKLMKMLQNELSFSDPDLKYQPNNNSRYNTIQLSVLKRAWLVLRPDQAGPLIASEQWARVSRELSVGAAH